MISRHIMNIQNIHMSSYVQNMYKDKITHNSIVVSKYYNPTPPHTRRIIPLCYFNPFAPLQSRALSPFEPGAPDQFKAVGLGHSGMTKFGILVGSRKLRITSEIFGKLIGTVHCCYMPDVPCWIPNEMGL